MKYEILDPRVILNEEPFFKWLPLKETQKQNVGILYVFPVMNYVNGKME